jgi:hypothetical protein
MGRERTTRWQNSVGDSNSGSGNKDEMGSCFQEGKEKTTGDFTGKRRVTEDSRRGAAGEGNQRSEGRGQKAESRQKMERSQRDGNKREGSTERGQHRERAAQHAELQGSCRSSAIKMIWECSRMLQKTKRITGSMLAC